VARSTSDRASVPLQAVAKKSREKLSIGGRKWAMRRVSDSGIAQAEIIGIGHRPLSDVNDRHLLVELVRHGEIVGRESVERMRERHVRSVAELPMAAHQLSRGEPAIPTDYLGDGRPADRTPFESVADREARP
jgi:nicotinate phosphoribosyltransferase